MELSGDKAIEELRAMNSILRRALQFDCAARGRILHWVMERADEYDDEGNLKFGSGVPTMPKLHRPNDELTDEEPTDV